MWDRAYQSHNEILPASLEDLLTPSHLQGRDFQDETEAPYLCGKLQKWPSYFTVLPIKQWVQFPCALHLWSNLRPGECANVTLQQLQGYATRGLGVSNLMPLELTMWTSLGQLEDDGAGGERTQASHTTQEAILNQQDHSA